jgi:NADH:ubiquinone oxidoreductase subunit 3 (subunit A)
VRVAFIDRLSLLILFIIFDVTAVYLGAMNGVEEKLSDAVDNNVMVTHCVAHELELGV